jgi:membrane-bound lytic murein transglycosylase MltF
MASRTKFLYVLLALGVLAALVTFTWDDLADGVGTDVADVFPARKSSPTSSSEKAALTEAYDDIQSRFGDLDVMEERRVIRVLTVYGVGRYYLDDGEEKGLVRESANRFEDHLNKHLKRDHVRVHVIVVPVARNQLIPALLQGRGDLIHASLSITPERQELVDFSIPESNPLSEVLITGPSAPALNTIDDLAGQTLYVRSSSSYRESVEELNERFRQEGRTPVKIEAVSELLEDGDLVEMVNAGLLPWAIVDDYKTGWWTGTFTKLVVRNDIVFRSGGLIAVAFRKDSPLLKNTVNEFIKQHREGTQEGNILRNRYIRDFDWTKNALAQDDYLRFSKLRPLFEKYGKQYNIEYLMIAAQAYQESRLDQNARSQAGAEGVMQIKPGTAADSNVDIRDIHKVEANIHAGVKYLDFLRRRYFSAPEIDELNQILLAQAAYNIGPGRMIKLRNSARAYSGDSDHLYWFYSITRPSQRDGFDSITVSDRIQSVRS